MTRIKIEEALTTMLYAVGNNVHDLLHGYQDDESLRFHTTFVVDCCEAIAHMIAGATGHKQNWSIGAKSAFQIVIDEQYSDEYGAYQIVYSDGKNFVFK